MRVAMSISTMGGITGIGGCGFIIVPLAAPNSSKLGVFGYLTANNPILPV
jgi:hypothetical protein